MKRHLQSSRNGVYDNVAVLKLHGRTRQACFLNIIKDAVDSMYVVCNQEFRRANKTLKENLSMFFTNFSRHPNYNWHTIFDISSACPANIKDGEANAGSDVVGPTVQSPLNAFICGLESPGLRASVPIPPGPATSVQHQTAELV